MVPAPFLKISVQHRCGRGRPDAERAPPRWGGASDARGGHPGAGVKIRWTLERSVPGRFVLFGTLPRWHKALK